MALVLLIACVNVASLQLALGFTRRREFVTRLAMGATYQHLARQVFLEGVLVALLGGLAGTALAWAGVRSADIILSPGFRNLPFRGDVAVDTRLARPSLCDRRIDDISVAVRVCTACRLAPTGTPADAS